MAGPSTTSRTSTYELVDVVVDVDVDEVAGMNSVGGGATVVEVDVVVFSSLNRAIESGDCISRPSSVSHALSAKTVAASVTTASRRRRMAPERRGGCHPSDRQVRR